MPCFYCGVRLRKSGSAMKTKDHVVPKSKGGTWTVDACLICNGAKADMSLEQFRQKRGGIEFYGEMCARQEYEKTAWIYDFSHEKKDNNPVPPSKYSSVAAVMRTISNYLPHGVPDLRGVKFGLFTVLKWKGKGRWEVLCVCGSKEPRSTRAVRNPENKLDACVGCRIRAGELRHDFLVSTGQDISLKVCFQYLYENSAGQD